MFRGIKQKLDRWAIDAAAAALPAGRPNPDGLRAAAEILAATDLLEVGPATAELKEEPGGRFSFRSNVSLDLERNDIVHGRIFRCSGEWRSKPLVLLVHGWNAELHYLYVFPRVARALNRRGINAAVVELPFHLQRRPPRTALVHDFISDDLPTMLRATRQALSDFHSLAGWALAQGCPNVAIWGFSLGAWLAGLYISGETLVSHAVLTTPIIDLERAVQELPFCHPIRSGLANSQLDLSRLNLARMRPNIPPSHIRVCRCEYDLFVPMETYQQLVSAWNLSTPVVCAQSHLTVLISRQSTIATIDWLLQQFKEFGDLEPSVTHPTEGSARAK